VSMDPQLKCQLAQTISVASVSSVSNMGDPTYGTPATRNARVVTQRTIVQSPDGEEIISNQVIVTEAEIKIDDRVWLPGDDNTNTGLARTPKSIIRGIDEIGNIDHFETYV